MKLKFFKRKVKQHVCKEKKIAPPPKKKTTTLSHFNFASIFFLVFRFRHIFLNKLNESKTTRNFLCAINMHFLYGWYCRSTATVCQQQFPIELQLCTKAAKEYAIFFEWVHNYMLHV